MATTLFPKRVDLDTASITELESLFMDTASDLQGYLFTLSGSKIVRSDIAQVRAQIGYRLQKLGIDTSKWVSTSVPQQYVQGQHDAARQQYSLGNELSAGLILAAITKNRAVTSAVIGLPPAPDINHPVISPKQETVDLHNQSMKTIMDSMTNSFEASIGTMSRSADQVIHKIQTLDIRKEIAKQAQAGVDEKSIGHKVSDLIKNSGISALKDAAGRQWTPESYANMLVRTKLTEARNNGMMNALQSVGKDLVEVSSHGATDVCGEWEGEILSISGDDPLYPSVEDATSAGLFHPNCMHSLNAVDPELYPSQRDV